MGVHYLILPDDSSDTADVPARGKTNLKNVHLLCARHYANGLMSHNPHSNLMRQYYHFHFTNVGTESVKRVRFLHSNLPEALLYVTCNL